MPEEPESAFDEEFVTNSVRQISNVSTNDLIVGSPEIKSGRLPKRDCELGVKRGCGLDVTVRKESITPNQSIHCSLENNLHLSRMI